MNLSTFDYHSFQTLIFENRHFFSVRSRMIEDEPVENLMERNKLFVVELQLQIVLENSVISLPDFVEIKEGQAVKLSS